VKKSLLRILAAVAAVAIAGYVFRGPLVRLLVLRPQSPPPGELGSTIAQVAPQGLTVVATGLEVPWEIAFLPDSSLLVTERPGRLVHIKANGRKTYPIEGVRPIGEGGLLGLALHPRYAENHWIYLYFTVAAGSGFENQVVRYRFTESGLLAGLDRRAVILGRIPAAPFHDGGRIAFGPDGFLYVTAGDATDGGNAMDTASLGGKILRVNDDGSAAPGNPFKTPIYSYGHRNPEGLAWDDRGRLWETEHGRSGVESGFDELNLIQPGGNYGWPMYQGDAARPGIVPPVLHSGPSYTWAPAGAAYWNGRILFGGLRGEALYEARITSGAGVDLRVHFHGELGRIRVVRIGPDGMLYLATSNQDGRGSPHLGDDKILKLDPALLVR